jgi:hypothetical protein
MVEPAPAGVSGTVISAGKRKRIRRLYRTNSAVIPVIEDMPHSHLQWRGVNGFSKEINLVLAGSRIIRSTAIPPIKCVYKFIPAESIAPGAFITHRAGTFAIITGAKVQAYDVFTLVFLASLINNGG